MHTPLHVHAVSTFCLHHKRMPTLPPLSEAMEARAHQRAERRKQIEDLRRKKEEEKLVRDQSVFM